MEKRERMMFRRRKKMIYRSVRQDIKAEVSGGVVLEGGEKKGKMSFFFWCRWGKETKYTKLKLFSKRDYNL